ncbi:hypothetical protein NXS19_001631 [Fusarium pseudograminearum]|nr:hypothetical protein NXS19_001631 [Fusarium pseudograminearum]
MSAQDYYGGYPQQPQPSYGPPQGQYGPPQGQYGPPQGQYGPRKDNTMALLKAKLLCNINKLPLNRVVERAAAAVA